MALLCVAFNEMTFPQKLKLNFKTGSTPFFSKTLNFYEGLLTVKNLGKM
jgi:hypothetical protein